MSFSLLLLLATFACFLIAGGLIWHSLRRRGYIPGDPSFPGATTRKLTAEEYAAVEKYLETASHIDHLITPSGAAPSGLRLNDRSHTVFSLTHAITRYGFSVDDTNQWRFYLDSTEVRLPLFWEQYITNDNDVELILTDSLPLIIALNGHTLQDYPQERSTDIVAGESHRQIFIRREDNEPIELLRMRQETPEEHAISTPRQLPEAILICIAFLILFLSVLSPSVLIPWLTGSALLLIAASMWSIYSPVAEPQLREIHSLRGIPKRWGLFGETHQSQINTISLGIIDLVYPSYWQPYIVHDLGQKTDIDIYLDKHVVRQGAFLSLHDEVRLFPLQRWLRPLIVACGSLTVLLLMLLWVPLEIPLKLSTSWLSGAKTVEASSPAELNKFSLHVGDTLNVKGTGICHVNTPDGYSAYQNRAYLPFDCSKIRWKTLSLQPIAQSKVAQQALALTESVKSQINPALNAEGENRINPQLATAIQKSGMILLDDFSGIVEKVQALCQAGDECTRLKNALVNLGNTKDWNTLVRRVETGKLRGVNVLLRPVSAESLNNLVISSAAPFFAREMARAAELLNAPNAGDYVFVNDEGKELSLHAQQQATLYDYPAQEQWLEFMSLAKNLSHTPFAAQGIITHVYTDTNGTRHIVLQSITDEQSHWRNATISILLVAMLVCFIFSSIIAVNRYRRDRKRLGKILDYYDSCLNASDTPRLPR